MSKRKQVTLSTQDDMLLLGGLLQSKMAKLEDRLATPFKTTEEVLEHSKAIQHVQGLIKKFDKALEGVIPVDESPKVTNKPMNQTTT